MTFKITKQNSKYYTIEGKITAASANAFKTHFNLILNNLADLTIDITNVKKIDNYGLKALQAIYNNAISWGKPFFIINNGTAKNIENLLH